ncbi:MAG: hypothetical protein JWN43_1539 [Gammaproteobacteria bacterium]|nr:hypothetical protein [Gammaproteobacteria bacterium]
MRRASYRSCILIEKAAIDTVCVRGHEIDTGATLFDMGQELGNPRDPGSRRASNPQRGIDGLDRLRCQIVEIEIGFLVGSFPKAREVGLVPDLEVPAAYFIPSITLFDMTDEGSYEVAPTHGLRMGCVAIPIEHAVP